METVTIQTTQNIEINYKLAGIAHRLYAFFLDTIIIFCYGIVMNFVFYTVFEFDSMMGTILIGLSIYLYFLLFEVFMDGQTLGKKVAKIRVVKLDGTTPTLSAYLLRWIMIPVDFMFSGGGVAILMIIFTKNGQRLGDLLAGTTVIQVNNEDPTLIRNKMVLEQIDENYIPTFPEAIKLGSRDVELIHEAIVAFRVHSQRRPVELLKQKMEDKLQVKSDLPPIKFLFTLAKDYSFYASA